MKFIPASETAKQEVLDYAKENLRIEDAKKILERNGYFVANLWHIDDVKSWAYECDDATAQKILHMGLTNPYVMDTIWHAIDTAVDELKLKRKEE
jgi:hypothetical protein